MSKPQFQIRMEVLRAMGGGRSRAVTLPFVFSNLELAELAKTQLEECIFAGTVDPKDPRYTTYARYGIVEIGREED